MLRETLMLSQLATDRINRRHALGAQALGGLALLCLGAGPAAGSNPGRIDAPGDAWPDFPHQPRSLAREFVGAAHGNIDKVRAMLAATPGLVHASWDWGFGDWETALGAASHTGNRAIAHLLLDAGARLDIFAAAMLGMLDVVKGMIAARPGIERTLGPHHITLLKHARAGGKDAEAVASYLASVPGADAPPSSIAADVTELEAYAGAYATAAGAAPAFRLFVDKGRLNFQAGDAQPRWLFKSGGHEFFPSGVPSVRLAFMPGEGGAMRVMIRCPAPELSAERVGG
jgi:hypothetical protein